MTRTAAPILHCSLTRHPSRESGCKTAGKNIAGYYLGNDMDNNTCRDGFVAKFAASFVINFVSVVIAILEWFHSNLDLDASIQSGRCRAVLTP